MSPPSQTSVLYMYFDISRGFPVFPSIFQAVSEKIAYFHVDVLCYTFLKHKCYILNGSHQHIQVVKLLKIHHPPHSGSKPKPSAAPFKKILRTLH